MTQYEKEQTEKRLMKTLQGAFDKYGEDIVGLQDYLVGELIKMHEMVADARKDSKESGYFQDYLLDELQDKVVKLRYQYEFDLQEGR